MIYVHYGSDHFYPELFVRIKNADKEVSGVLRTKPHRSSGLWASRAGDRHGWADWCRENRFELPRLKHYFKFTLEEAKVLEIGSEEQLIELPEKIKAWSPKMPPEVEPGKIPTTEQLEAWFKPNPCYLDFERLAKKYDAIEVTNGFAFHEALPTWDCNCILVMNPDKMREIDSSEK